MAKREIILNLKKNKMSGHSIGENVSLSEKEAQILALLSNNYCISKKEISNYVFKQEEPDYIRSSILVTIKRLRNKGLRIKTKVGSGYIIEDKIYIDY